MSEYRSPCRRMGPWVPFRQDFFLPAGKFLPPAGPPAGIAAASLCAAALSAVPLFYILLRASQASPEIWIRLWRTRIPELLFNTIGLAVTVTAVTIGVSVLLAYLTVRTDLPGRDIIHWLMAVPLAIPAYIGAFAYITFFGHNGIARQVAGMIPGLPPGSVNIPSIYGFSGSVLVLSLFTFPYVYLLSAASLKAGGGDLEEASLSCGLSRLQTFFRVTLPLLRPSLAAGGLLVFLYVLSDFGTVAMLRFPTFTSVIYLQLVGRYDRASAAVLSVVLLVMALAVIYIEWRLRTRGRYYQPGGGYRPPDWVPLGRWRYPAVIFTAAVILLSVAAPVALLAYWTVSGISGGSLPEDFLQHARNSLISAASAATASIALALPIAFLSVRHNGPMAKTVARLVYAGYALPGVILALGMVLLVSSGAPFLHGTAIILVLAYIARFLPQGLQAEESALARINPCLEESARLAGYSPWPAFLKVTLPLIRTGLVSGWTMVFISSLKELPATLLLRPAGFDTLAVRVWIEASEGFFERGAPAALILIIVSTLPLKFLFGRDSAKGGLSR
ncbi:MAG: ABC transporter permease [Bacillota bacterium]